MSDPIIPDPPAEPTPAPVAPVAPPPTDDTFPRSVVEDLRRENAEWRTKLRDAESVFEGYDPETIDGWKQLIGLARQAETDPEAASQLQAMLGYEQTPETDPESQPQYMTRADFDAEMSAREAAQQQTQAVEGIQSQARQLGYDLASPDYVLLLHFANAMDAPDISAAHAQVQAYRGTPVQDFLAGKIADANGSPVVAAGLGTSPSQPVPAPKSFEEARARMAERLANAG